MDRLDAMQVFVTIVAEGSLAGAGRKLGRSPAAVSRAIAFLEALVGTPLLHRTTRSLKLSDAGDRYAAACRRLLADLAEADQVASLERTVPRGMLCVSAPVAAGEEVLRPMLEAFIDAHPGVSVRLVLQDHRTNLIEEGIDVALRISHLPDSSLVALRVGEVRRVVAAAPAYLAAWPRIAAPADLAQHQIIAMANFGIESWSFPQPDGAGLPRTVHFAPRLIVNSVRSAIASAVDGRGVTRLFSYHIAEEVRAGVLRLVLTKDEYPPYPVHLVALQGRLAVPKVRAFVDFAVPLLRTHFARLKNGWDSGLAAPVVERDLEGKRPAA
jgi:DNA-binding transcriptional LysR family regulator